MNIYTRVLTNYAKGGHLRVRVTLEAEREGGFSDREVEETRTGLRELGLHDELQVD